MTVHFHPLPTTTVRAYQAGAPDAHGNPPERAVSDGGGNPCRHCLCDIPKGSSMLILAHCPFEGRHAYAEVGPIFLCADACEAYQGTTPPPVLTTSPEYLLKGYSADERIVYGTGRITPAEGLAAYAAQVLGDKRVAFVDVRSASNNCWQARIMR